MTWKVLEFYGKLNDNNKETFCFKLIKFPPTVSELSDFESKLTLMVNNMEFHNNDNDFHKKTQKKTINEIRACNKILVSADKSRNL